MLLHTRRSLSPEKPVPLRKASQYWHESAGFAPVPYKWRFVIKLPEDRALLKHVGRLDEVQLSGTGVG